MSRTIRTVTIENKRGLHARASMAFVTLATAQSVELTVEKDGNTASGTSILDLMMLGAAKGDTISISAEGDGADGAVQALVELVEARFNEE
ncbi:MULTISPECIES: HPr family phosphocarrier protein [Sphingomonas]|uniref:Phosphocarrier protein n=1 Tax=Sphingomonas kyeonggiensis TaxID=1268553 RepID=A0A7W7K1P3_9SPHN|nr:MULTISPECIES: HPr family phosphocarrier protein [Sphingomonas]MBB4839083.1 phosphocarrier protein [Sphingomonas kyeonggiensis]WHU03712.1 HPr family phosphocarrier protein [Sphingomonas sp. NIBR02145]